MAQTAQASVLPIAWKPVVHLHVLLFAELLVKVYVGLVVQVRVEGGATTAVKLPVQ